MVIKAPLSLQKVFFPHPVALKRFAMQKSMLLGFDKAPTWARDHKE